MTTMLAALAYGMAGAVAFILLIGAAIRAASSLGARPLAAAAEVTGRPGGEAAVADAPHRDETRWRDELFEYASLPCEFDNEGRPCPIVPGLEREVWCRPCLSGAAIGLPVVSLPPTTEGEQR